VSADEALARFRESALRQIYAEFEKNTGGRAVFDSSTEVFKPWNLGVSELRAPEWLEHHPYLRRAKLKTHSTPWSAPKLTARAASSLSAGPGN
jgi:hypothetical protein